MKSKVIIPLLLVAFLAGSAVGFGQDKNQKKIERIQKKIERQQQKLHEITGEEMHQFKVVAPRIDRQEIEKIREEAMAQQEKAMAEFHAQMEEKRIRMDEERDRMEDRRKEMQEKIRIIQDQNLDKLNFKIEMPDVKSNMFAIYDERDVLDLENKLDGESQSADFPYEVKAGTGKLSLTVNGSIDEGKVLITIKQPDGTAYNEYTLSPLANVAWKQTISLDDENAEKMVGKWTVTVVSNNAKGTYKVHISSR